MTDSSASSYSKKGRRRPLVQQSDSQGSLSPTMANETALSPTCSSLSDSLFAPTMRTSQTKASSTLGSPVHRLSKSFPSVNNGVNLSLFGFEGVEDPDVQFIPSYKRKASSEALKDKAAHKQQSRSIKSSIIHASIDQDKELNTKYYIESKDKPIWSPSKLKSPIKMLSPKRYASSPPIRRLDFPAPPTEPDKQIKTEQQATVWSLLDEASTTVYKPKLPTKKAIVQKLPEEDPGLDQDYRKIQSIYEDLLRTPKKSGKRESFTFEDSKSPVSPSRVSPLRSSPSKQRTYSAMRSFRADADNHENSSDDGDVLGHSEKSPSVQDINQLRINGANSRFQEELDYLIEDIGKRDMSVARAAVLEITLKLFIDNGFFGFMEVTDPPQNFFQSILEFEDPLIHFCCVILCCKLSKNRFVMSQLQLCEERINEILANVKTYDVRCSRISKVTKSVLDELLQKFGDQNTTQNAEFYFHLFLKSFKDCLYFEPDLIDLATPDDEKLFIYLSVLESSLLRGDATTSALATPLVNIVLQTKSTAIAKSCQILSLKCLILLSPLKDTLATHPEFLDNLFAKAVDRSQRIDDLDINIRLLQLGLILDLVDNFEPRKFERNVILNIEMESDTESCIHIAGYTAMIIGHLAKMRRLSVTTAESVKLIRILRNFRKTIKETSIIQNVDKIINYLGTITEN